MKRWRNIFLGSLAWIAFSMYSGQGMIHLGLLKLPTLQVINGGGLKYHSYAVVEGGGGLDVYPGELIENAVFDHAALCSGSEYEAYQLMKRAPDDGGIRGYQVRFDQGFRRPKGVIWAWRWKWEPSYQVRGLFPPDYPSVDEFLDQDLHMLEAVFDAVAREEPRFWGRWGDQLRVSNPVVEKDIDPLGLALEVMTFLAAGAVIVSGCVLVVRVVRRWMGSREGVR